MKQMKRDLQSALKLLNQATQKIESLEKRLEGSEKSQGIKKPKSKGSAKAKAPKELSQSDILLAVIKRHKKGIDSDGLRKKTGFEGRRVGDILYRLKRRGKIKSVDKGAYVIT